MSDGSATPRVSSRAFGLGLTVLGLTGLGAAFALTIERIRLLEDPAYSPSCDLNPIISCGSVMVTPQATAFGFPNPLLGLVAFTVVVTLGVLLLAGARPPRWILAGLAIGATAGLLGVHWLIAQSLYDINALCPWCMLVWIVTMPIAVWSVFAAIPDRLWGRAVTALWSVRYLVVTFWYLVIAVLILVRFWDYWRTLL